MSVSLIHSTTAPNATKNGVEEVKSKLEAGELEPVEAVEEAKKLIDRDSMARMKRIYLPPSQEDLKGRYATDKELRRLAAASEIPFIHEAHADKLKLYPGFILVGGVSGTGKSTSSGCILEGFIKHSDKTAFLVTNEDSMADAYDRTACCIEEVDFKRYRNYKVPSKDALRVDARSRELMKRIVIEGGSESYDMTCLEDVQAVLIHIAENAPHKYGLAMVDYLQTVNWSRENSEMAPVQVSKALGFFLKDYARKVPIPIIVYVQLRPDNDDDGGDFKARIENDRTIYNHAFVAVEVVPDYENRTTRFVCHKDRFWNGMNQSVEMRYEAGRYIPIEEGI